MESDMNLELNGRKALITAGTAGIGFGIAKALAAEGAVVTITSRKEDSLSQAISSIESVISREGAGSVLGIVADAGTTDGAARIASQLRGVDILINNLGVYESKPFAQLSDDDWRTMFEINVMSGVRMARSYLPGMVERRWGRVIFIASEAAVSVPP